MSPVVSNEPSFPLSSPSSGVREEIDSVSYESLARSASIQEEIAEHEAEEAPMYRVRQDSEQSSSGISISR